MANVKISELTALTPPAAADELVVVDVSATSTKKTTVGEVVGIITGDVEVASNGTATISELPVSKLQDGTARQLLQTDAAGTGVEWASNIDVPGTLDVTGAATFDGAVTVTGDLTVNGTTTTISTQNLLVEDKNIIIGDVATPTDTTADGGGITLKGATDKTINWVDSTDAWTSSERFSIPLGSAAAPTLTFTGDPNTGAFSPSADALALSTGGNERARIDSSGRLLVGTSTALTNIYTGASATTPHIQLSGSGLNESSLSLLRTGPTGATIFLNAGSSENTVQSSSLLGRLVFNGYDGSNYRTGGSILCEVDGTPGANDMPGRFVFSTTADGAATPTERLRITSAGVLQIAEAGNITVGTTTGTKIGTATTQKLGFYNKTPVAQPSAVADATDAASVITQLNALLARMRDLGLIAT
jgi:hypothetical protein